MADNRNATGRALQRIAQIHAAFSSANSSCSGNNKSSTFSSTDANTSSATVCIGDVVFQVRTPEYPELVPSLSVPFFDGAQDMIAHLRWMAQKDLLGQDIDPGPLRRHLVLRYAQLSQREIEYVAISRDVSDTDLKQRREIKNGTAFYIDQACVRAAIFGRLLILDGVEKAERNVLPLLNNLLENREMALDDGRFLVHPKRYDSLIQGHGMSSLDKAKKYDGFPLDPPFRSRFQSRSINPPTLNSSLSHLCGRFPSVSQQYIERLVCASAVLRDISSIPDFPIIFDNFVAILQSFPKVDPSILIEACYPYLSLPFFDEHTKNIFYGVLKRFDLAHHQDITSTSMALESLSEKTHTLPYSIISFGDAILPTENQEQQLPPLIERIVQFRDITGDTLKVRLSSGSEISQQTSLFVMTPYHEQLLTKLLMVHTSSDICITGDKGCGKSAIIRVLCQSLGYQTEYVCLYKDFFSRDLLQRRNTLSSGDTVWENSGLIEAALNGRIAILDQIDALAFGTLASIQRLIVDRELSLPDGSTLVRADRFKSLIVKHGYSRKELAKRQIFCIHPSFRIIGIARSTLSTSIKGLWLTPELASMFLFVPMRNLNLEEETHVIQSLYPHAPVEPMRHFISIASKLRLEKDDTLKEFSASLSTRQLLRIARYLTKYPQNNPRTIIFKATLYQFLPALAKDALDLYLDDQGVPRQQDTDIKKDVQCAVVLKADSAQSYLQIGDVSHPILEPTNPLLIPDVVFFENSKQTMIMQEILRDYSLGEHLLIIGNQGVGKNKIVDRFLQLLRLPREYIQLHRDVTVSSLTSCPTIVNGCLVYEDSPLVRAVREGYILVVDEADKAPTHVTAILKSLVEDANRPGFPFLGNDFWREVGDVFACHVVENPDSESEMQLLKHYAPETPDHMLLKAISLFNDLRKLVDEGLISYPYSTRELVNVVKHMQAYPSEGLSKALQNVFDFDLHEPDLRALLIDTMTKHGVSIGKETIFKLRLANNISLSPSTILEHWHVLAHARLCISGDAHSIQTRGPWPLRRPPTWEPLILKNERATTFTELLYTFKLPCVGNSLDIIHAHDHCLLVATAEPSMLTIISPDHRTYQKIELYEYVPATSGTRLYIAEVSPNVICILNSVENNIVLLDFIKGLTSILSIVGMDPAMESTMCAESAAFGYLPWPRSVDDYAHNEYINIEPCFQYLKISEQLATLIPSENDGHGWLELLDKKSNCLRRIDMRLAVPNSAVLNRNTTMTEKTLYLISGKRLNLGKLVELPDGNLLFMNNLGLVSVVQIQAEQTAEDEKHWKKLTGMQDENTLKIIYNGNHPDALAESQDMIGQGGNEGSGQGQSDQSGSGGSGGGGGAGNAGNNSTDNIGSGLSDLKGRESGNINESTFQLRSAGELPKEITEAQLALHHKLLESKLKQLDISAKDMSLFTKYKTNVQREIRELRVILEGLEAKEKERVWIRNKTNGDIDETKLVEGLAGDRSIYRIRGDNNNDPAFQKLPKKLHFVFDLSASMMRFNGHDGRMERSLECAVMLMEAFRGFEYKLQYKINGHSGDGPNTQFIQAGKFPKTEKDMLEIINRMSIHASYCISGDNTVDAVTTAIKDITEEEADDYFVLVLSDANLNQYNISPETIATALKSDSRVNAYMIFIGNLSDQAHQFSKDLGGHAFVCLDNKELPKIMKTIFLSSFLK
ncbi:hypothetical protein BATDEDRAFT_84927 [Batrachochytrium dendrobatidis JAM81]|uniref:VWFA domain-containing protein n=1 Tax=Batrachochytrium dendrobatidis (strain JAM81 / FGSC 10211) TaxID=684364 RepID=F4NS06_BATDJ|nr:uncharacterized protein BATDEDRAFT_84927 [Batrachochytrium dendrobatidis JAM81]EGF84196.1 hypothetical protein BATDEDRAFT_84927 [Batrachochytrium dendrobatidis JAM81]|eukprot:XP_006676370.1 hypothetical protein BATDEDRAFT_84927 [Batrachochytrium dendrobatidis JAM81]